MSPKFKTSCDRPTRAPQLVTTSSISVRHCGTSSPLPQSHMASARSPGPLHQRIEQSGDVAVTGRDFQNLRGS
jgi:hypothetical protein